MELFSRIVFRSSTDLGVEPSDLESRRRGLPIDPTPTPLGFDWSETKVGVGGREGQLEAGIFMCML